MAHRIAITLRALAVVGFLSGPVVAEPVQTEIIFQENFSDASLPAWRGARLPQVSMARAEGPNGLPALSMEVREPSSATFSVRLPVTRIAGKAVLLDV
jgi:hypothetical protein